MFGFHSLRVLGGWYSPRIHDGVPVYLWPAGLARFSIDMFFVLSGFLVTTTWWSRRRRLGGLRPALAEYGRNRFLRIFPVFWASLLVLIPLRAGELLRSPLDFVLLAGSQQYLDPDLPGRVNVVTWSLTVETHFYLLLPLLAVLVSRRLGALVALSGSIALSVWWFGARGDWPASIILGRLDQFVAGMVVALLYRRWRQGKPSLVVRVATARGVGWLLGAVLLALGVFHGSTLGLPRDHWLTPWQHPVAGLALAGLGLRLLCTDRPGVLRRVLERPSFLVLGAMSYSLYLWHVPILETSARMVGAASPVFALALAALASFAAAALSYSWIELPFMRRKQTAAQDSADTRERPAAEPAPVVDPASAPATGN